jgi:hypothetical protein
VIDAGIALDVPAAPIWPSEVELHMVHPVSPRVAESIARFTTIKCRIFRGLARRICGKRPCTVRVYWGEAGV